MMNDTLRKMKALPLTLLLICALHPSPATAQELPLTLDEAIQTARRQSVAALEARASFISSYWSWRSWQAEMLPSVSLYGEIGSFNRSLTRLQNYETGEYVYTATNNMTNSLGLAISQNIGFTGGTLKLYSDLSRIDQFGDYSGKTWYGQPLTLYYSQPLLAYNEFKWNKKISPKEYEKAKRVYLEAMEEVTSTTVEYYFDLMLARQNYETALSNYANTSKMHEIAAERLKLGSVTRDEYLSLELRMLNDSISINENEIAVREAQMLLNSQLGLEDSYSIITIPSTDLPDISMGYEDVIDMVYRNSSFGIDNEIKALEAQSAIAQAKANRGATVSLTARFGLSQSGKKFHDTYLDLLDQEVVGLTFSIPIFDWGMGRGRVKEAEAQEEVVKAQIEQAENDYRKSVFTAVGQFNKQRGQCLVSKRASVIAQERYELTMEKFRSGSATVTELNTAQSENDEAAAQYITDLGNFWNYYYALRQLTLHDFIGGCDLDVDYNEIIE